MKLKLELYALYLACQDPRTPWYAKVFVICLFIYVISPIDLVPDLVPVLGYLDDIIIVPIGLTLALKMIPPQVITECRNKAGAQSKKAWIAALVLVALCLCFVMWLAHLLYRL